MPSKSILMKIGFFIHASGGICFLIIVKEKKEKNPLFILSLYFIISSIQFLIFIYFCYLSYISTIPHSFSTYPIKLFVHLSSIALRCGVWDAKTFCLLCDWSAFIHA